MRSIPELLEAMRQERERIETERRKLTAQAKAFDKAILNLSAYKGFSVVHLKSE